MRKDKVVFDYRRISVPRKIAFAKVVLSKMKAKELFADPDVPYKDVESTVDKLEKYYLSSRDGSHTQIALMHQMKEEYDIIFRNLGQYVDRKADGDAAIIVSAGFNLVKQPKPRVRVELRIERGDIPGTVKLRRTAVDKATAYIWQHSTSAEAPTETDWIFGGCSAQTTFEISGLTPQTKVWFRVAAVTREGMQAFTDPIMKAVL